MGSASSSQSGSASYSIYFYTRSRRSERVPPAPAKPTTSPPLTTKPVKILQPTTIHPRVASASVEHRAPASTNVKERRAWYRRLKRKVPASKQKAKESALIVRSLIIGPPAVDGPKVTKAAARPELTKLKSHLVEPKSANRIIAELRTLPVAGNGRAKNSSSGVSSHQRATEDSSPIHAVCLEHTDVEEDKLYFSKLAEDVVADGMNLDISFTGIGSASIDRFAELMNEIHVVDLIQSPNLGLGQPGDGPGVLAGAVPTPETIIKGIEQITPQLMAFGYAAGRAIVPDHKGTFPPTDRMSILTYWWGLEVLLPPPSLKYLASTQSITGAVINFLTALSLINNGVREILPFVRYISQFIDFEFNQIKKQDQGKGVVCAATWVMPAALVPRPWDFPDPPIPSINPPKDKDELDNTPDASPNEPKPKPTPSPNPSQVNGMPFLTPIPRSSVLEAVTATNMPPTRPVT